MHIRKSAAVALAVMLVQPAFTGAAGARGSGQRHGNRGPERYDSWRDRPIKHLVVIDHLSDFRRSGVTVGGRRLRRRLPDQRRPLPLP